jgi:CHAD domain-containing protein
MVQIIRSYYTEHKSVFEKNFAIVLDNFDIEAIHKMRTSTKRLRALLLLIKFLSPEKFKAKRQLSKLRLLFKHAGKIREIQIEMVTIDHYTKISEKKYPEYLEYLKGREHKEIARFLRVLPEIDNKGHILNDPQILEVIQNIPVGKIKKRAEEFIDQKKEILLELNQHPLNYSKIHENRTHLKQLYYLYEVLRELTGQHEILKMKSEKIREIEQLIGSWHDLVNSNSLVNAYLKTKDSRRNKKYKELGKKVAADRKKMLRQITGVLNSVGLKAGAKARQV